ncbi:DMT family transporter [Mesobaculum littorinae]|uniref:DMT family transporter n=1 Tax=Mesobaculum littorinae TaxID=2486419 RepID=A0A438AEM8_9RHOB|nr:DMT family transporter [Mesobaculum littorinae]RVV97161.1 DMT family transporter [Mesobaculum littorinae]
MPFLILSALLAGAMLPLQGAFNARLGRALGSAFWAAGVSAFLSAILLFAVGMYLTRGLPRPAGLSDLPLWAWAGGICGVITLAGIALVTPRLGAAGMVALVITGQVLFSLLLDRLGLFDLPQHPFTFQRFLAAGMLLGGAILIR